MSSFILCDSDSKKHQKHTYPQPDSVLARLEPRNAFLRWKSTFRCKSWFLAQKCTFEGKSWFGTVFCAFRTTEPKPLKSLSFIDDFCSHFTPKAPFGAKVWKMLKIHQNASKRHHWHQNHQIPPKSAKFVKLRDRARKSWTSRTERQRSRLRPPLRARVALANAKHVTFIVPLHSNNLEILPYSEYGSLVPS